MKVGEKCKVYFQENITTGYTWVLLEEEIKFHGLKDKVKVSSSEYIPPQKTTERPLIGAPGTRCIEIEALDSTEEGSDNILHFILCRPWELQKAYEHKEVYEPVQSYKSQIEIKQ